MTSQVEILLFVLLFCISTNCTQLFGDTDDNQASKLSDVYIHSKTPVNSNGKQLPHDTDVNQDHTATDVYSHSTINVSTEGKQLLGDTDENQDSISSDVNKHSKTQVMQGNHQQEYDIYKRNCPNPEDISPCVCTYEHRSSDMNLDCSAVESQEQLRQIFKTDFYVKKFRELFIYFNHNSMNIEPSMFNGVTFERIEIDCSGLKVINLKALDCCYETANSLYFVNNKITSFPFDELSLFSKLTHFDISYNSISMIPANAFDRLTNLETLDIGYNTPNIVGTFKNLPNLENIYLYGNELTNIPVNFIKTGSIKLRGIYLENNNIVSVEPGAFDIVKGLKIHMSYNSLSTLDERTWRPLLKAKGILRADANPLTCGCDIAWLFKDKHKILLDQVTSDTTCIDGQNIHDLNPRTFDHC